MKLETFKRVPYGVPLLIDQKGLDGQPQFAFKASNTELYVAPSDLNVHAGTYGRYVSFRNVVSIHIPAGSTGEDGNILIVDIEEPPPPPPPMPDEPKGYDIRVVDADHNTWARTPSSTLWVRLNPAKSITATERLIWERLLKRGPLTVRQYYGESERQERSYQVDKWTREE